jgi:hypothetical protein
MTCRKRMDDIKIGVQLLPRDKPGGYLSTALVVSGMKVARARIQALVGNVGTPRPDVIGRVLERSAKGRTSSGGIREGESTDAGQAGGPPRSSDEARVTRVERRGRVALVRLCGQPEFPGGAR